MPVRQTRIHQATDCVADLHQDLKVALLTFQIPGEEADHAIQMSEELLRRLRQQIDEALFPDTKHSQHP